MEEKCFEDVKFWPFKDEESIEYDVTTFFKIFKLSKEIYTDPTLLKCVVKKDEVYVTFKTFSEGEEFHYYYQYDVKNAYFKSIMFKFIPLPIINYIVIPYYN